jgi:hypothetical protein
MLFVALNGRFPDPRPFNVEIVESETFNGSVSSYSSDLQLETVKLTRRVSLYWVTVLLLLLSRVMQSVWTIVASACMRG